MKNRLCWQAVLVAALFFSLTCPVSADVVFTLIPSDGNVFGAPGSLVGWGYSLTNTDPSNWFLSTNLSSDSFSNGTPTVLFDFPILAPGVSAIEAFDSVNSVGLFELQWDVSAPAGFVNSGNFILSGELWDGDPFNGGNFVADALDSSAAYSAVVTSASSVPEPATWPLMATVLFAVAVRRCGSSGGFQTRFLQ